MKYNIKLVNAKEHPEELEVMKVPDREFTDEYGDKHTAYEYFAMNTGGMQELSEIMREHLKESESVDVCNLVAQALADRIEQVYRATSKSRNKQLDFLAAVFTLMDLSGLYGTYLRDLLTPKYESVYMFFLCKDVEQIKEIAKTVISEVSNIRRYKVLIDEPELV